MMTRPLYETDSDLSNEEKVITFLVEKWGLQGWLKLSLSYGLDYAMCRIPGVISSYVEIKVRPGLSYGAPGGYFLSLHKVMRAREINAETGSPCHLVVSFPGDGSIYRADMFSHEPGCIVAGRTDRGDPLDQEPHVVYPWEAFRRLK